MYKKIIHCWRKWLEKHFPPPLLELRDVQRNSGHAKENPSSFSAKFKLWNSLQQEAETATNLGAFKRSLDKFMEKVSEYKLLETTGCSAGGSVLVLKACLQVSNRQLSSHGEINVYHRVVQQEALKAFLGWPQQHHSPCSAFPKLGKQSAGFGEGSVRVSQGPRVFWPPSQSLLSAFPAL